MPAPVIAHARRFRAFRARTSGVKRSRGFTLVEMIIAAGLIGFIAITATWFWVDGFGLARTVNADSAAIADGRAALERLAREIREVKYNQSSGAFCISTMAATQMVFNKHQPGLDPVFTACGGASPGNSANDIAVTVQAPSGTTNLNLGYAGSLASPAVTRPLTQVASSFQIRYLDAAYGTTNSTGAVRFVELSLTVQPSGVQATPLRTVVALRNN